MIWAVANPEVYGTSNLGIKCFAWAARKGPGQDWRKSQSQYETSPEETMVDVGNSHILGITFLVVFRLGGWDYVLGPRAFQLVMGAS